MEPVFLTLGDVAAIHHDQIRRYGGAEGIRDVGLLKSAVAIPAASFGGQYVHADLHEMAAAYLYHIVGNHPFIDGNKRVGAVAAYVFLHVNGLELTGDEEEFERVVTAVAAGRMSKSAVAEFFRENTASV